MYLIIISHKMTLKSLCSRPHVDMCIIQFYLYVLQPSAFLQLCRYNNVSDTKTLQKDKT